MRFPVFWWYVVVVWVCEPLRPPRWNSLRSCAGQPRVCVGVTVTSAGFGPRLLRPLGPPLLGPPLLGPPLIGSPLLRCASGSAIGGPLRCSSGSAIGGPPLFGPHPGSSISPIAMGPLLLGPHPGSSISPIASGSLLLLLGRSLIDICPDLLCTGHPSNMLPSLSSVPGSGPAHPGSFGVGPPLSVVDGRSGGGCDGGAGNSNSLKSLSTFFCPLCLSRPSYG